jgi:hypothetical protein
MHNQEYYIQKQNQILSEIKIGQRQYQIEALKTSLLLAKIRKELNK